MYVAYLYNQNTGRIQGICDKADKLLYLTGGWEEITEREYERFKKCAEWAQSLIIQSQENGE